MKFHVIPRERSDRGNPFSCDAKHRAAFSGRGNGLRLAKSRPTGGCSLARACGRSLRLRIFDAPLRMTSSFDSAYESRQKY